MVTWPSGKARVCKTLIHQFKSGRHLQKIPGSFGFRDFLFCTVPCRGRNDLKCAPLRSAHIQRNDYFYFAFGVTAFAERSVAMKAPVGLLSGRAVCVSRWRGFAPTSSAERSKRYFHRRAAIIKGRSELQMPFSSTTPPVKRGFRKARRLF